MTGSLHGVNFLLAFYTGLPAPTGHMMLKCDGGGEGGCRTASLGLESLTVDTLDAVSGTSFCSN